MNFKPSAYLLNVNNNKVSKKNEYFHFSDISLILDSFSISFWIYVSKDWFDGGVIDDVFLFAYDKKYFGRIYTDDAGLVWLEVFRFSWMMGPGPGTLDKNGFTVLLDGFSNRWHHIVINIPNGFYTSSDYGSVYYDGLLINKNIFGTTGTSNSEDVLGGLTIGAAGQVPAFTDAGVISGYSDGNFIGYIFDLAVFDTELDQSGVDEIFNTGVPWSGWAYGLLKSNVVYWSRLQDRKDIKNKITYIKDDKTFLYKLKFFGSRENRFHSVSKLPTNTLLSEAQIALAKTRSNNLYKTNTIPEKEFQNAWIKNCALEKTKYYDLQGVSTDYAAGTQLSPIVFDESLIYKYGSGTFSKSTVGGIDDDKYLYFELDDFQTDTGVMTGVLFFLMKVVSTDFNPPDLANKAVCFVINFALNHTTVFERSNQFFDTYPDYLAGPLDDPPIDPDVDDFAVYTLYHTGNSTGSIWELRLFIPNFSGVNETINYEYSYFFQYSYINTADYIPLV